MKCPFTGKPCLLPKDIHVTEIVEGATNKLHLCSQCGIKYVTQPDAEVKNTISQVKSLSNGQIATEVISNSPMNTPCPKCGATASEILKNQKIGCDVCYTFHPEINSMVRGSQRILPKSPVAHVGKVPESITIKRQIKEQIDKLNAKLQAAIKQEHYEKASVLRDAIKELNKQLDE